MNASESRPLLLAWCLALACAGGGEERGDGSGSTSSAGTEASVSEVSSISISITDSASSSTHGGTESTSASTSTTVGTDPDAGSDTSSGTEGDGNVVTIYEIQDGTVAPGVDVVIVDVVVTGVRPDTGLFVQELEGGERSGIYVDTGSAIDLSALSVGDRVDVEGTVREDDSGALADLTRIDARQRNGSVLPTGQVATATPITVALSVLGDPEAAEAWEGVLVTVDEDEDVDVVDENAFDEFAVGDGTDVVWVDDLLYNAYDQPGTFPNLTVGAAFESVTGPLNYSFGLFKVAPRSAGDLAGYVAGPETLGVDDLSPGDLVITELMYNPEECADANCEYIEIYNASGSSVNLNGLRVRDETNPAVTISQNAIIPADTYRIIGRTNWGYQTVTPLVSVAFPGLNNTGTDQAVIANSNEDLDATALYTALPAAAGYAWKLNVAPSHVANDDPDNWCYAPDAFEGDDHGSPNAPNNPGCTTF
jgi:hypothetical protein